MERILLQDIVKAVNGQLYIDGSVKVYDKVSTDTRKIEKGSIFIALKGENFNGNDFVIEASKRGAALCIIDEVKFNIKEIEQYTSIIVVNNTNKALLDLAKYYRSILDIKIVGITGSTGKTSTKDMVAAVLKEKFKVFKTEGNFNNEIGLPLMIFNLDRSYEIAVLEMGMSNFGEIHNMADAARPDIALITNIGISHIENLKTRENIMKAKLEITDFFDSTSALIVNGDNDLLFKLNDSEYAYNIIKIGIENNVNFKAKNIRLRETNTEFDVMESNNIVFSDFQIDVPGKHNVLNCLLAIACGKLFGMNYEEISSGIRKLEVTSMRLDIVEGEKFTIIDDCYNASPDSMKAAIDVLKNIKGKRRIAVLGTMRELGEETYKAHKDIGEYARKNQIDLLICLGENTNAYSEGYDCASNFKSFENIEDASEFLSKHIEKEDIVLIKASRAMKFEGIVKKLKNINY